MPTTSHVGLTKHKTKLPKRLAALCLFFTVASISGIIAKQGVLFCILTLLMVVAILGRQRSAMYMLQGYTVIQLGLISMLPIILYDPDNLVVGNPSLFKLGGFEGTVPDYLIFAILILLSMLQVWIAFTPKVKAYFNSKINLNIMN
ncbi:hypothetical protein HWQ46_14130 [Shewanella sp. D64]|uniref:hypothetical protein n=1 Tax=unclassified Shewanella TaxID=196818 RepID=UPI0022BA1EB5|nr:MULTISPECIES: hypothetical protein [unclassified Shewanella]MEC4726687.1 hypothetical protein [Shewanella sp. D64]MEC4738949.1 hypothetical protein [Shewanella sp. E94]WBJ98109.1 hypothetical protein HWQ47_07235 [Shewanella sp. MTB7]